MTKDILFLLLRASLTASLSDREAFIGRVSKVIEDQTHTDPEAARRMSDHIAGAMEGLNSSLLFSQLVSPPHDKKLNKTMDELTAAIEKLNALLEESGLPGKSSNPDSK